MSCAQTLLMESNEEPILTSARPDAPELRRRRHSSYHPGCEGENVHVVVDRFLAQLNRRLEALECYTPATLSPSIETAWSTLLAVHSACNTLSTGAMETGRRRASVLVETLESHYSAAVAKRETLEAKALHAVQVMESFLSECEARAVESGYEILDGGRRRVDEGIERAKGAVDGVWRAAETIEQAVERALAAAKERGLIRYHELPEPWRVNEHIKSGYRFHDTKLGCIRSICSASNETFNIWSHLLGLIIVLSLAFYVYPSSAHFSVSTKSDVFIAGLFFFAAAKCLVCSTMWHTFNSIAEKTLMERFACVDYTGISLLVAASIMTTEYTAFYCEPVSRIFWISTTALLGIGGVILPWHPTFNRSDMAWARVGFYVTLAATGALPVAQLIYMRGLNWAIYFYAPITKSLLVYLIGAIMYACKVPERWFPGMFDYVGGSHNLWHVAVLGGILFHYYAMQQFFAQAFMRALFHCSAY
ncbi:HlyIII-domain-containing protein [Trichodelitschia bisporula]|uniref:HlyIII-domain-containing protein n=1 Tax=Trichodelitschia bisporula TaxID=703511 RepID=A0A6G1IBG4_9PEZI|nr:HlyIII-domain-containing protein [Trichodelitschia bisporula]